MINITIIISFITLSLLITFLKCVYIDDKINNQLIISNDATNVKNIKKK